MFGQVDSKFLAWFRPSSLRLDSKVSGIGGWMIIPILGLFLTSLTMLIVLLEVLTENIAFFWSSPLVDYGVSRSLRLIYGILAFYVFVFSILSLILIFKNSRFAPTVVTIDYALTLSYFIFFLRCGSVWPGACYPEGSPITDFVSPGVGFSYFLWAAYFPLSERARNTFVR